MTATMPEEDVAVLLEPAEPCFGVEQWNGHEWIHQPCGLTAAMEILGHCENCDCDYRRGRCLEHHRGMLDYFEVAGRAFCANCLKRAVVIVAVLPL